MTRRPKLSVRVRYLRVLAVWRRAASIAIIGAFTRCDPVRRVRMSAYGRMSSVCVCVFSRRCTLGDYAHSYVKPIIIIESATIRLSVMGAACDRTQYRRRFDDARSVQRNFGQCLHSQSSVTVTIAQHPPRKATKTRTHTHTSALSKCASARAWSTSRNSNKTIRFAPARR